MKTHSTRILALSGLLFVSAAAPAFAQGVTLMTATIPFEFSVAANGTLPAGRYTVTEGGTNGGIIFVQANAGKSSAMATVGQRVRPNKGAGTGLLVFHRYGRQYFLAQVISGDDTMSQLSMTRTEKLVIKNWPDHKLAQNNVQPEVVTVIAGQR